MLYGCAVAWYQIPINLYIPALEPECTHSLYYRYNHLCTWVSFWKSHKSWFGHNSMNLSDNRARPTQALCKHFFFSGNPVGTEGLLPVNTNSPHQGSKVTHSQVPLGAYKDAMNPEEL